MLKERRAVASADTLAAWKKWGSFFLISCAAIVTVFQSLSILQSLLSLGTAGQVAISRLAGWLLFAFGVTVIVSALFLPGRLIAPVMGSLALAMLVAILVRHRQLPSSELTY